MFVRTKITLALLAVIVIGLGTLLFFIGSNVVLIASLVVASAALGFVYSVGKAASSKMVPAKWLDQLPHPIVVKDSHGAG
jgi:5-bromo-4-chloroindolyl phosphate hydrolysis protein